LRSEAVVDLYDPIATLVRVLVNRQGPLHKHFGELKSNWRRRALQAAYFAKREFQAYIDALQSMFTLRMRKSIPSHESRDNAFMLRSGVSKLIAGMDVPLKCCIGLYRWNTCLGELRDKPESRQKFTGVVNVNFRQSTSMAIDTVADGGRDYALMAVNMDVFHLFQPERIFYLLHEVGHLFFRSSEVCYLPNRTPVVLRLSCEEAPVKMTDDEPDRKAAGPTTTAVSRTSEIFADLVAALFVFEREAPLFSKMHGLVFSDVPGCVIVVQAKDDENAYQKALLEVVFRGFIVHELISSAQASESENPVELWPEEHPKFKRNSKPSIPDLQQRFREYIGEYSPFYKDMHRTNDQQEPHPLTQMLYLEADKKIKCLCELSNLKVIDHLWKHAVRIWRTYWQACPALQSSEPADANAKNANHLWKQREHISQVLKACLNEGNGIRRSSWPGSFFAEDRDGGVDCFFVVARLLREYIRHIVDEILPQHTIFPEEATVGSAESNPPARDFSPYLMRESHAPLHPTQAIARARKLLAQISFYKTLSDLSSQLRARRFVEICTSPSFRQAPSANQSADQKPAGQKPA
jgi:hypothetical protein